MVSVGVEYTRSTLCPAIRAKAAKILMISVDPIDPTNPS